MPEVGPQSKEKLLNNVWHGRTSKSQSMIKNLFSKLFEVDVKHNIKVWFKLLSVLFFHLFLLVRG